MIRRAPGAWPPGESELARCIRAHDWAATPLGPVELWPQSLRTAVGIVLGASVPMAVAWGQELVVLYNDALRALIGQKHPHALGRPAREVFPRLWKVAGPMVSAVLEGQGATAVHDQLLPIERRGGFEDAWFDFSFNPIPGDDGRVAGILHLVTETTARVRAQAAASASEARQAFLLELGDALRDLADPLEIQCQAACLLGEHLGADRVYYAEIDLPNERALVVRDYRRRTADASIAGWHDIATYPTLSAVVSAGRDFIEHDVVRSARLRPEERASLLSLRMGALVVLPLMKAGRFTAEFVVTSDQARAWTERDLLLVRETAERTWAAVERARAEAALRQSEERYRLLVENVRDYALFVTDTEGRIASWGPGAERVFGYRENEIVGTESALFFTHEDRAAGVPRRALETALARDHVTADRWQVRKGGERFWASGVLSSLRDGSGALRGFAWVCRDITAQKRAEEQREAARAEAEAANRAKDEFLAVLGHELRTPLAPILLWGRAMLAGELPLQELGRAIQVIVESAESQYQLIEDLLDLSRMTSGRLQLALGLTDVERVARAALEVVHPSAQAKRLELSCDVDPQVGHTLLDPRRFQQILWNLLSNAVKFTPAGGRVSLRLRRVDGQLEAEVADTGQGIEPEFLPHLFERFRQADMAVSRSHGGLGIGLALCRQLVELHGGTIHARSDGPDRGAVFTVRIPCVEAPAEEAQASEATGALAAPQLDGLRVLLVEDDPLTREAMVWSLEHAGAVVQAVPSASEALRVLEAGLGRDGEAPDVMVSDIGLPGIDGYELIRRAAELARARGQDPLPSCAVSAHARAVDRRRAIEAGFDLYLSKPVSVDGLIGAVAELAMLDGREPT